MYSNWALRSGCPRPSRLLVGLQAVAGTFEQGGHTARADGVALPGQLPGQPAGALARPAERGLWVAAGHGIDQRLQRGEQAGVGRREVLAAATGAADARGQGSVGLFGPVTQLAQARSDGGARQACGEGNSGDAAPTEFSRFRGRPLASHALVHQGPQDSKLTADAIDGECVWHATGITNPGSADKSKLVKLSMRGP